MSSRSRRRIGAARREATRSRRRRGGTAYPPDRQRIALHVIEQQRRGAKLDVADSDAVGRGDRIDAATEVALQQSGVPTRPCRSMYENSVVAVEQRADHGARDERRQLRLRARRAALSIVVASVLPASGATTAVCSRDPVRRRHSASAKSRRALRRRRRIGLASRGSGCTPPRPEFVRAARDQRRSGSSPPSSSARRRLRCSAPPRRALRRGEDPDVARLRRVAGRHAEFTRTCAVCRVCTTGTMTPKLSRRVIPYSSANGVVTMRASLRTSRRPNVSRCAGCSSASAARLRSARAGELTRPQRVRRQRRRRARAIAPFSPKRLVVARPGVARRRSRTHPPGIGVASSVCDRAPTAHAPRARDGMSARRAR